MKKHNCIKWHEEGQGCAICSKSGLLKKDEVLQIQSWSNAHISELKGEIGELHIKLDKALSQLENEDVLKREPKKCDNCQSTNTTLGIHCRACGITQIKA
jgi:hypothetical protein